MALDTKSFVPKELTPEELEVMSQRSSDKIVVARVGLLPRHPFFGNMATRLKIQSSDDWCPNCGYRRTHTYTTIHNFLMHCPEKQPICYCTRDTVHLTHLTRREDSSSHYTILLVTISKQYTCKRRHWRKSNTNSYYTRF